MLMLVITCVTGCSARHTEGTERTDRPGLQATGGEDSRGRHGNEMVEDRRRGSME